jgi:hypothetical protein
MLQLVAYELRKRLDFHSAAVLNQKNHSHIGNEMFQYFMDDIHYNVHPY